STATPRISFGRCGATCPWCGRPVSGDQAATGRLGPRLLRASGVLQLASCLHIGLKCKEINLRTRLPLFFKLINHIAEEHRCTSVDAIPNQLLGILGYL